MLELGEKPEEEPVIAPVLRWLACEGSVELKEVAERLAGLEAWVFCQGELVIFSEEETRGVEEIFVSFSDSSIHPIYHLK